jgi:hypothetical protein
VEDAYEEPNRIEVFGGSAARESADQYGVRHTDAVPPEGAFVFYDCRGPVNGVERNWGHVGISCGKGNVVPAWDAVREDDYRDVEKLPGAPGWTRPKYIGWTAAERILQGHCKR